MGIKEIQETAPHRYPFLPVGCIEELEPGMCVVSYKYMTYDESLFKEHSPQEPAMPGVLLVGTLAQTRAVAILSQEGFREKVAYSGGIKKVRLKRKVVPGDKVRLEYEVIKQKGSVEAGEAIVAVDGKPTVSAEPTFTVGQGIEGECRCLTGF